MGPSGGNAKDPSRLTIALVNMPFAMQGMPALGLTQLEAVVRAQFGDRVTIATHYLNLEFARQVGNLDLYHYPHTPQGFMTDAGEWMFRQVAFPELPDNAPAYLDHYFSEKKEETRQVRDFLLSQRAGLEDCLERLIDAHGLAEADIVGFTLLFSQTMASFAMARLLKRRKPRIITVFGGPCCEGEMGQVFVEHVPQVDYCFSGPALVSFPTFLRGLFEGRPETCDRINGVFSKTNHALWSGSGPQALSLLGDELDIDACILPDYDAYLAAEERFFPVPRRTPALLFETSRGCAWGAGKKPCRFCGLNGLSRRYRQMNPANALRQIKHLWQYVPRSRFFIAVDNLMPPRYPREVFAQLTPPKGIGMRYEVRPTLTGEEIRTLHEGGVTWLQPGIESLASSTLRLMQKGVTAFSNLQFLKRCTTHPVTLEWNLLIGTPGETDAVFEKYERDLPRMTHLPPPTGVFPVMYVKSSEYYEHPEEFGLTLQPAGTYAYLFPFAPDEMQRVAFRFSDASPCARRIDEWLDRLNAVTARWRERYEGTDGHVPARFCLVNNSDTWSLYDSRDGEAAWHPLTALELELLRHLESPLTSGELSSRFPGAPSHPISEKLDLFTARGWVFQEDGRYLSLLGS